MASVGGYSLVRITPWYKSYQRDYWERRISDNLGINVRFAGIEFPRPDHFRAHECVCVHPETGVEILRMARLDVAMDRSGWTVDLLKPELNGQRQQLQSTMQVIHDWFLCRPQKSASLLKLTVPELLVYDGPVSTKFQCVEVGFKPTENTSTLFLKFALDGQKFSEPASLRVERNHTMEPPKTTCVLVSNEIAIPCSLLAQRFPSLYQLGGNATFQGTAIWSQSDVWAAELSGKFASVDLSDLTAELGSPVRGLATLAINNASIKNGTVDNASGSITTIRSSLASHGASIDTQWLRNSIQKLQLLVDDRVTTPTANLNYLTLDFSVNDRGLTMAGKSVLPDSKHKLIMRGDQLMVAGSALETIPLDAIAAWLQPASGRNPIVADFLNGALPFPYKRVAARQ